jgi:ribulose kinase
MNEGGQSSTGQLIDFVLTGHCAYPELVQLGKDQQKNIHTVLDEILEKLRVEEKVESLTELTKDIHLYPDFHGNRSPIADPRMRGSIVGLELDHSLTDLAKLYHATMLSISLQTKHIIDTLNTAGHAVTSIYMSGGQAKNQGLMQSFADVCDVPIIIPVDSSGAVVLGAAMLGRYAAEAATQSEETQRETQAQKLWDIMVEMTPPGDMISPNCSPRQRKLLNAKYKIFLEAIDIQKRWRKEIETACA